MLTLLLTMEEVPDRRAFLEGLYRDYHKLMYWTAQKYIEAPQDQADVVHDSLVRLIQKADRLQAMPQAERAAYISATVHNTAFLHLRQTKMRQNRTPLTQPEEMVPLAPEDRSLERLEDRELLQALGKLMTEEERLLLEGKFLLELPDGQLARMLGCKPESLRTKLHRTRRNLRKYLQTIQGGTDHDHL